MLAQGSIPLIPSAGPSRQAFLIRFPEQSWAQLEEAARTGQQITLSNDGDLRFHLRDTFDLQSQVGTTHEIHHVTNDEISLLGISSSRLNIPFTAVSTAKAADRLKAQLAAMDKERKQRADRVNGKVKAAPVGMTRTQSGPPAVQAVAGASTSAQPVVPLKTRVVQLLALGPSKVDDIVRLVGGAHADVMRVVKVVGRALSADTYSLSPSQYSKVKLSKYTHAEQQIVIKLANLAFDELGLPPDAPERALLEESHASPPEPQLQPTQSEPPLLVPPTPRTQSPAPSSTTRSTSSPLAKKTKQSAIAKEMAKFRAETKRSMPPKAKAKSPSYTSSEEDDRGRSGRPNTTTRTRPSPSPSPENMRDRYEELFPAYQQLTQRLVHTYQAAEGADVDALREVERMVTKWEKWHNELAGIRQWFSDA